MQTMARGETGGLLLLAYSNVRGYGDIHPALGELRVGYVPVMINHPLTGEPYEIGKVKITEAEVIARFNTEGEKPKFSLGYGVCFGHNEVKAISMAILDRAMATSGAKHASCDQEFVLSHVDGIESMGFTIHWKLPHYVTFQSDLDRLRKAQEVSDKNEHETRRKSDGNNRYNFAFLDENAKKEIRRRILKGHRDSGLPGAVRVARTADSARMGHGRAAADAFRHRQGRYFKGHRPGQRRQRERRKHQAVHKKCDRALK